MRSAGRWTQHTGHIVDKADGFSITVPGHWTAKPISREPKYSGVEMRSPDFDRTRIYCGVTTSPDAFTRTQEDLNKIITSGQLMHVTKRMAKRGFAIQSGKTVQFAKDILGFATEGTQRFDHFFSQTTDRFESLQVLIPGRAYVISCFASQADFADRRKTFDGIIRSFKLLAFK
ncbi:MAG TPA: hypothetical protein VFV07_13075, partial [Rhizomicrobium sp.]|nr:hypothetical protein [Rhizomicrobium sp.]